MNTAHIILGVLFIVVGGCFCLLNWVMLLKTLREKRFHSVVPIVGALLLAVGLRYFEVTKPYALLAILADYGTLVSILSIPHLARTFWDVSRFNLLRTFMAESKKGVWQLNLYKKGIFVIRAKLNPPEPADKPPCLSSFGYHGKWRQSDSVIELSEFSGDRVVRLTIANGQYVSTELNFPTDQEQDISVEGLQFKETDRHQTTF